MLMWVRQTAGPTRHGLSLGALFLYEGVILLILLLMYYICNVCDNMNISIFIYENVLNEKINF